MNNLQQIQTSGVFPLNSKKTEVPESQLKNKSQNLLAGLIPDDVFETLQEHGLLDEKAIRDYHIRNIYKEFRRTMTTAIAIEKIQQLYPYLQFDTIRKLVYKVGGKKRG